jgi:transposase InsO family protein
MFARESWYYVSKLEAKDREVAHRIHTIHCDYDDTLGHKKLAPLMGMGKERIRRVMKKYHIHARKRSKKYIYQGKSTLIQPNTANEETIKENYDIGVVFSDIFEFKLSDGSIVRGCFALFKQTRQILSLMFDYSMKQQLVHNTIKNMEDQDNRYIWHSDQGKQYGAEQTLQLLHDYGMIPSMSRAGTPTDNPYAERFVGTFKHAVVRRDKYPTLGSFLDQAQRWINFYNDRRPHEGLKQLTPNAYAKKYGWKTVPYISNLSV